MQTAVDLFRMDQDSFCSFFSGLRRFDLESWRGEDPSRCCTVAQTKEGLPSILAEIKASHDNAEILWVMYVLSDPVPTWVVYARVGKDSDVDDRLFFPGVGAGASVMSKHFQALMYCRGEVEDPLLVQL